DDDCRPDPGWLRALDAAFEGEGGEDRLVGGRTANALSSNVYSEASQAVIDYLAEAYARRQSAWPFYASNNMAARRELYLAVGGFDARFRPASEDRELCERWRAGGHPLAYAPGALVLHAHELTLRSFWRQQSSYGRGA